MLKEENRRLFGEQVNDHIEKLNELMGLSSGAPFNDQAIRRTCLATRLLEGSARMLDLDAWSRTLKAFRELLEQVSAAGRRWDEHLAQIVSEVLETEEQIVAEILAGELEEIGRADRFEGLQREIEYLAGEQPASGAHAPSRDTAPEAAAVQAAAPAEHPEHQPTFAKLIDSLAVVRDMFREYIDRPSKGEKAVRDLEVAFGESEFFMGLVAESLRRLGKYERPFTAKISCGVVLGGLKDFFETSQQLRRWNARLATRCGDFALDREMASALAAMLNGCIFDICRRYEVRDDLSLTIGVDIRCEGSYVVAKIQDNGPDYLCDSEIDRDDAGAFYPSYRNLRNTLAGLGSLLWLEPGGGSDGRFKFTLPRSRAKTDYQIVNACGKRLAVPCHAVDTTLGMGSVEKQNGAGGRHVALSGARVSVFGIDEIAIIDEFEEPPRPDRVLILGLGDKRVGLLADGTVRTVECVADQVTEDAWAGIARRTLHIGEEEFPIIDVGSVLRVASSLQGTEGGPEEAGSYADEGQGCDQEATVPRA